MWTLGLCFLEIKILTCDWQKNRYIDQWDRTESPEIDLYRYRQLVFDKGNSMEEG